MVSGPAGDPSLNLRSGRTVVQDRTSSQAIALEMQIVQDQLAEARSGLWVSMPISAALSMLILAMEQTAGNIWPALVWFACVNLVNGARLALASSPAVTKPRQQLRQLKSLALLSGFCWSYLAVLTNGFLHAGSSFHLIILAGICAGAVTYGGSCAQLSVNFIAPPLVVTAGALLLHGTFDSTALAFAVGLFFLGLYRSAHMAEGRFQELSRLRREAELFAQEMERRSREDPLTGLLNRRGFEQALGSANDQGSTFAVVAIDLDGFKSVNDTYGHRIGDELLVEIARRISGWAAPEANLARIGGDEFAVVHRIAAGNDIGESEVSALIDSIAAPYQSVPSARIGSCIGVYKTKDLDLRQMLLHADAALNAAKARGSNAFYFFDDELRSALERRQDIERDIPAAIEARELTSWFQPIVRLDRRTVAGFESLLRWTHPVHGPISPPEIVTAAREIGALTSLAAMVFSNCCDLLEHLGRSSERKLKVAMNLSPFELEVTDTQSMLVEELRRRGLSTGQFEIEITEESSLDYVRVDKKLKSLAEAGISIALDDFGTGFSTFSSIRNGWINKIKIDKEFVGGSPRSPDDAQLVKSIIDLGKALGIEVSAEGVETEETAELLLSLGCNLAQGFLYSRPVPISEVLYTIERIETGNPRIAS